VPGLRLAAWAELGWIRKAVALLELKAEALAKLTAEAHNAFLWEEGAGGIPGEKQELKEQVKAEAEEAEWVSVPAVLKADPGLVSQVEQEQVLPQKAERELEPQAALAAVLSMALWFRGKGLFRQSGIELCMTT